MSWQTLGHWFSVLVLPAYYPSSVLEVSVPGEAAKLQCKAQHFKTVLKAVVLVAPGTWLLVPVCPHSLVLVQVVNSWITELNHPERTETLKMGELEHSWEHFPRHQGWLNRFPALAAHSDSHTIHCSLSCHMDVYVSWDHGSSLSYTFKYIQNLSNMHCLILVPD